MMRSILKVVLTTLALILLFAGSIDLNSTSANAVSQGTPAPRNWCWEIAGCEGGPYLCAQIHFPDGTVISCFTEGVEIE